MTSSRNIVTVNAGSSSIKVAVFTNDTVDQTQTRWLDLSINNIGQPVSTLIINKQHTSLQTKQITVSDHTAASRLIMDALADFVSMQDIAAVGHRIVHGGVKYSRPVPVTDISDEDWQLFTQLDPEHTLPTRQLIIQFMKRYSAIPHVACFDTAFFHEIPHVAKIVPISQKYYSAGVRRYGFHGLSYTSLLKTFRKEAGDIAANGRIVLAHLGSGASLAAVRGGKPVDMTMGFTPTSGIVMSTRAGDIDPTVFGFLHEQYDMEAAEFDHMVRFESGLLGVSGVTGDMHALLDMENDNEDVAMAIELFIYNVKKSIGALATTIGGIDSLIFSGGIGERSAILRERICKDLGYMGIEIDVASNGNHAFLISSPHSRVGVHVIATDESSVIAAQTQTLIDKLNKE